MAKVTNQIIYGNEETYTDADGKTHYLGETYRHVLTEAYPLPSLNPSGVIRKTPRGYRPTEQGQGSPEQAPWRDCFQACAERWRNMPDECPDPAPCPTISSKKLTWEAKQQQGVPCSYYDLYLRCCLSSCTEITIYDTQGNAITGGSIPDDDNCFKCEPPCKTSTLSVAYTTARMKTGESQALRAHDSIFGFSIPCCQQNEITWEIVKGGGYLSDNEGLETIYFAPATNPYCALNPTIELRDCCQRTAQIEIAVNGSTDTYVYKIKRCYDDWSCGDNEYCPVVRIYDGSCDGIESYNDVWCGGGDESPAQNCNFCAGIGRPNCAAIYRQGNCAAFDEFLDVAHDTRQLSQIADGCCPEELL